MDGRERLPVTRLLKLASAFALFSLAAAALAAQANPPAASADWRQANTPHTGAAALPSPAVPAPAQPQTTETKPAPPAESRPIAIVPLDTNISGHAAEVTGSLHVYNGRAFIDANGTITSGPETTHITLPYRGTLLICASTTINLAADSNPASGSMPGLLMALDHGAVEMSFANSPSGSSADILMTPDFRILVGGSGGSEVKVRLGQAGDTCIDNTGKDAPYVVVTSLFDAGLYRVQPGQRVMLQHGSLNEVNDQEKEPCGCPPPPARTAANEFPLAQSEGLEPLPPAPPVTANPAQSGTAGQVVPPLVYSGGKQAAPEAVITPQPVPVATPAPAPPAPQPDAAPKKKPGVFTRIGHFFKRVFGAE